MTMTSDNTARDAEDREGQDDQADAPSRGEIRFLRFMRLVLGLAVPVVAVVGIDRIATSGGDPLEVVTAFVAVAVTALFCAYAGARATQLQTEYDEAAEDHPMKGTM